MRRQRETKLKFLSILAARDTSSKVGKRSLDGLTREVASGNGFWIFVMKREIDATGSDETE